MLIVYGLKNCDTCRRAVKALAVARDDVSLHDVRADPLPSETLKSFLEQFGDALINRKSTTWRALSEKERDLAPLALLAAYPALLKRPVIEANGAYFLGWDSATQLKVLGEVRK